jgi:hypothetical protein
MTIKKILVVDDSPTERHVLKVLLTSNGYEVITAESGEEGIAKAKKRVAGPDPDGRGHARPQWLPGNPNPDPRSGDDGTSRSSCARPRARRPTRSGACARVPRTTWSSRSMARSCWPRSQRSRRCRGMTKKISLHEFQSYLAARLAGTSNQSSAGLLGIQAGSDYWLLDLADSGEIVPLTPLTKVPLTKPWFAGIANIRGNLYSVVDLSAFLGKEARPRIPVRDCSDWHPPWQQRRLAGHAHDRPAQRRGLESGTAKWRRTSLGTRSLYGQRRPPLEQAQGARTAGRRGVHGHWRLSRCRITEPLTATIVAVRAV